MKIKQANINWLSSYKSLFGSPKDEGFIYTNQFLKCFRIISTCAQQSRHQEIDINGTWKLKYEAQTLRHFRTHKTKVLKIWHQGARGTAQWEKVFALHMADLGSIPGIPHAPQNPPEIIPECRNRVIPEYNQVWTKHRNNKIKLRQHFFEKENFINKARYPQV